MVEMALGELRKNLNRAEPFQAIDKVVGSLIGGHAQTLLGHFLPSQKKNPSEGIRVEVVTTDGDRLVGFQFEPEGGEPKGLLHIFHGLAGSSDSPYMPRAARAALELGFTAILWNHRGCGHGRKLALEPYHSGRSDDLARVVKWGRDNHQRGVHGVLGYSLSGNATCLLAARVIPMLDTVPLPAKAFAEFGSLPDFAIAINPPFDLKLASRHLSGGFSRVYGQSFMPALLQSLDDRKDWKPENSKREQLKNLTLRARKKLGFLTDVRTFDATYTGPAGGFQDHDDYYERCSSGRYAAIAVIPLIILSADDDPITKGFARLARLQKAAPEAITNPLVVIDDQPEGGHMGYVDWATFLLPVSLRAHSRPRWLENRIQIYLRTFLATSLLFFFLNSTACTLVNAWKPGVGPSRDSYKEGLLVDCPIGPNCVSTQSTRADHLIVPFTYSKPISEAREALKVEMSRVAEATLMKEDGAYLHFECRSRVMRFADDVEFIFDEESKTLQFRSASRFGYSDWGVNRKRMEEIRNKILGHI